MGDQYWLKGDNASSWTITDISCSWEGFPGGCQLGGEPCLLSSRSMTAGWNSSSFDTKLHIFIFAFFCQQCSWFSLVFCVTQETMEMLAQDAGVFVFWLSCFFWSPRSIACQRPCGIPHRCSLSLLFSCLSLVSSLDLKAFNFSTIFNFSFTFRKKLKKKSCSESIKPYSKTLRKK